MMVMIDAEVSGAARRRRASRFGSSMIDARSPGRRRRHPAMTMPFYVSPEQLIKIGPSSPEGIARAVRSLPRSSTKGW